jgi:hypothetical protein
MEENPKAPIVIVHYALAKLKDTKRPAIVTLTLQ